MDEFVRMPLDFSSFADMGERITSYKRKAKDLCEFVSTQKWGQHTVHVDRSNEHRPKITGSLPDQLVLEALYRRFRFFILNDEKANYFRLLNLISQSSDSDLVHKFTKVYKKELFEEDSLQFAFITAKTKYTPKQVIDFWFNSYYFHDQAVDREQLATFQGIVSDNGAKVVLFHAVWNAVRKVRNLNYLLRETSITNQYMYIPHLCKI